MKETERERNRKEAYSRESQDIREEKVVKRIEVFKNRCKVEGNEDEREERGRDGE